ncbi:MAG: DUF1829 domain-containing protein [Phycisphaeraceae bacterium]
MKDEIQQLTDRYVRWLQDRTTLREVQDWVEITTPYLDRHNDHLQIYAQKADHGFLLTDDGYIVDDLEMQGCKLDSPKREALLKQTLNGFGVTLQRSSRALEVKASIENFPAKKHALIQAMLAVNDLFYLASPSVASFFMEDVITWLDERDIRYTRQVKFTGTSGYDHLFDFVIPKSRSQPERVLQAISKANKDSAQRLVFEWLDTRDVRPGNSKMYALLNDTEQSVPQGVREAFSNYEIEPVAWSERDEVLSQLAA